MIPSRRAFTTVFASALVLATASTGCSEKKPEVPTDTTVQISATTITAPSMTAPPTSVAPTGIPSTTGTAG